MFIDYLSLLLANMAAGLFVLATYLLVGAGKEDRRAWAAAFLMPGLVAFAAGLHMSLTWPTPKLEGADLRWANVAFGELSVLLGVLFLGASWSLAKRWSLAPLAGYALIASAAAALVGARIYDLGLTRNVMMTTLGFALTAGAGVLTAMAITGVAGLFSRVGGALALLAAAAVWAYVGASAYWGHLAKFSGH